MRLNAVCLVNYPADSLAFLVLKKKKKSGKKADCSSRAVSRQTT